MISGFISFVYDKITAKAAGRLESWQVSPDVLTEYIICAIFYRFHSMCGCRSDEQKKEYRVSDRIRYDRGRRLVLRAFVWRAGHEDRICVFITLFYSAWVVSVCISGHDRFDRPVQTVVRLSDPVCGTLYLSDLSCCQPVSGGKDFLLSKKNLFPQGFLGGNGFQKYGAAVQLPFLPDRGIYQYDAATDRTDRLHPLFPQNIPDRLHFPDPDRDGLQRCGDSEDTLFASGMDRVCGI